MRLCDSFIIYGPEIIGERLEDRIVLDAAVDPAPQDNPDSTDGDGSGGDGSASQDSGAIAADQSTPDPAEEVFDQDLRVVLISNAIDEIEAISAAALEDAQVIVYDAEQDNLDSICEMLESLAEASGTKIEALAVVGHGSDGLIQIGVDSVSSFNLEKFSSGWGAISEILTEDAQIQFYGCEVAQSETGREFVDEVALLTGADVFAGDDDTSGKWGDWDLEYSSSSSATMTQLFDYDALPQLESSLLFPDRPPLDDPADYDTYTGALEAGDSYSVVQSGHYADVWTFTLTESMTVSIGMQTLYPGNSGNTDYVDSYLILYSGLTPNAANVITQNDDWGGATSSDADHYDSIIQTTLEAGDYCIETTTYAAGDMGPYNLLLAFTQPATDNVIFPDEHPLDDPDNNYTTYFGDLEYGDSYSVVRSGRYADTYTFTVDYTTTVSIGMQTLYPGESGNSDYVDCYLILYSGDTPDSANVVAQNDDWGGGTVLPADQYDSYMQLVLTPGEYTIELTSYGSGDAGPYKFAVHQNSPPDSDAIADVDQLEDFGTYDYDVSDSFTDVDNDDLTFSLGAVTYNGGLVLDGLTIDSATGVISFTSHDDSYGSVDVSVRVYDGEHYSDYETFTLTVISVPELPIAYSQDVALDEDNSVIITITGYDSDMPSLGDVSFDVIDDPDNGTLTLVAGSLATDGNGNYSLQYTYTPTADYYGADSFDFNFITTGETSDPSATVSITVNGVYDLPSVDSDFIWVAQNSGWVDILVVGYSPEGYDSSDVVFETLSGYEPEHGSWQWSGDTVDLGGGYYYRVFQYMPDADYWGTDSFQFVMTTPSGQWLGFVLDGGEAIGSAGDAYNTLDVQLVDLDNDGQLDLVTANGVLTSSAAQNNYIYFNNSEEVGGFDTGILIGVDTAVSVNCAYGDLNNDGYDDLVVRNSGSNDMVYLWNETTDQFDAGVALAGSSSGTEGFVAVGDLDNDGWLDIVVATGYNTQDLIYMNNGDGTFAAATQIVSDWSGDSSMATAIADLNGDGYNDLIMAKDNRRIVIHLNDGSGNFTQANSYRMDNGDRGYASYVEAGDVDGDGDMDFVVANEGSGWRSVDRLFLNDGTGAFTAIDIPNSSEQLDTQAIRLSDIDCDGDLDVIAINASGQANVYYLYDGAAQSYSAGVAIGSTIYSSHGGDVGDVDGDGLPDVVVGVGSDGGANGQNRLYRNLGFEIGTGYTRYSEPGTISIHVGLFENWSFETGDYTGWNLAETDTEAFYNTFGVVSNYTHVGQLDLIADYYPDQENPLPQIQFGVLAAGLDIVDGSADASEQIAAQFTNGPTLTSLWQDVTIPDDATVTDLVLTWRMAYWNEYPGGWDADNQYLAIYVYVADGERPEDPVWVTDGSDPLTVDEMTVYFAELDTDLVGETVRVEFVTNSGYFFMHSAIDQFRIIPTREGDAPIPYLAAVAEPESTQLSVSFTPSVLLDETATGSSDGDGELGLLGASADSGAMSLYSVLAGAVEEEDEIGSGLGSQSDDDSTLLGATGEADSGEDTETDTETGSGADADPTDVASEESGSEEDPNLMVALGLSLDAPAENGGPELADTPQSVQSLAAEALWTAPNSAALVFDPDAITPTSLLDLDFQPAPDHDMGSMGSRIASAIDLRGAFAVDPTAVRLTDIFN